VFTGAMDRVLVGELGTWHGELRLAAEPGAADDGPSRERRVAVALSPLRDAEGEVERITLQMQDVTARHHAEARLIEMALHDALTGLPNRTLLRDRLGEGLTRPAVPGTDGSDADGGDGTEGRLALLFCDLDDFKLVNDSAGHRVGDALLVEVARRLGALRPDDTVARLGGDEFVILSPVGPGDPHAYTDDLAALVLEMLTAPVEVAGARYRLSASIGITLSRAGSTPESLLREADSAMYQAKRTGKNRSAWYTEEHHLQASRQLTLAGELRAGLERGEFVLFVQPVVDLRAGRVVAGEALVRWQHPERGLLPPGEWLDVAETCDVIHALGSWVIDESCRLAAHWREVLGDGAPVVHANVSARQLGQGTLVADVSSSLARHGLPGSRLVLELTETQLDHAHGAVLSEVVQLRAIGVGLAADDFGTGYSSLTRLTEMPVDVIKIDRAFVARMDEDERARAVVSSLVTMGAALDVDVVAEGVETRAQAQMLARMGCHLAQGYWWSRPVPDEDFVAFVAGHVTAVVA
jgi:diguanylate cyclase (GGDEF)-like protein